MADQCEKCGGVLEPGDVRCPKCGADLPAPVAPPANGLMVVVAALLPLVALLVIVACLGGIVFAGLMYVRGQNRKVPVATAPPPAVVAVDAPAPPPPVADKPVAVEPVPPPQPAATPPVPQVPAAPVEPAPAPEVADVPEPTLTDFVPPIAPPGSSLVLRGSGLAAVNKVLLISSHGAASVAARIIYTRDNQVIVTVPEVSFADYGIIIAAFSPGGVAILADQHTGATPWGIDGNLHDTVVSVQSGDEISTHDHMVVLAKSGSEVTVANACIVFMHEDVKLHSHGRQCQVYFVGPASHNGLNAIKALNVCFDNDAFRVKPAPPDQDQ